MPYRPPHPKSDSRNKGDLGGSTFPGKRRAMEQMDATGAAKIDVKAGRVTSKAKAPMKKDQSRLAGFALTDKEWAREKAKAGIKD